MIKVENFNDSRVVMEIPITIPKIIIDYVKESSGTIRATQLIREWMPMVTISIAHEIVKEIRDLEI